MTGPAMSLTRVPAVKGPNSNLDEVVPGYYYRLDANGEDADFYAQVDRRTRTRFSLSEAAWDARS